MKAREFPYLGLVHFPNKWWRISPHPAHALSNILTNPLKTRYFPNLARLLLYSEQPRSKEPNMPTHQPSLLARDDTFFGVCQAIGDDFGFNPNWLRVALPVLLFLNPTLTLAGYAAAGVVVFVSRWFYPEPRVAADAEARVDREPVEVEQDWVQLAA